jgi:hypothetical protein
VKSERARASESEGERKGKSEQEGERAKETVDRVKSFIKKRYVYH